MVATRFVRVPASAKKMGIIVSISICGGVPAGEASHLRRASLPAGVIWYRLLARRPVMTDCTEARPSAARRLGSSYSLRPALGQNQRTLRCICLASS